MRNEALQVRESGTGHGKQLGPVLVRLIRQREPQLGTAAVEGVEDVVLCRRQVHEVIDENRLHVLERPARPHGKQVAGAPQPSLRVEQMRDDEALLIAGVEAGELALLGVAVVGSPRLLGGAVLGPAVGGAGELARPDFLTLQLLQKVEQPFGEAARVQHAREVRQVPPAVQLGDDLVHQQPPLHPRQGPSRRVVGRHHLVGEILERAHDDPGTAAPAARIAAALSRGRSDEGAHLLGPARTRSQPQDRSRPPRRSAVPEEGVRLARAGRTTENVYACCHALPELFLKRPCSHGPAFVINFLYSKTG